MPVGGPVSIGLAGETLTVSTPVVASLAGLAQTGAGQVGLIIGQDALAQRVMLLQFSANRLAMRRTFEAPREWGRLPLTVGNQGRLCIPAAIGAARASAVFDLGSANAVMASAAFIRSHGIADGLRTSTELIGTLTGEQVAETFTAPRITIGSYTVRGAPVDAFARWSDEQAPLNVGLPLILRFDLAVDIAERVLWLSPNAAYHSVFAKNRAGLGVAYEGDRLRVVHVSAGSPAARTGWRSEDFITRVNGRWIDAGYYSSGLSRWRNGPAGAVVRLQGDFRGIRSLRLEDLFLTTAERFIHIVCLWGGRNQHIEALLVIHLSLGDHKAWLELR